jgi:FkbM family methyltransferase
MTIRPTLRLRGEFKRLVYGSLPLLRGAFPYYGCQVFFPTHSHMFERACVEGIYEQDTLRLVLSLVKPQTTYIDVGANIGLLSIPVLTESSEAKVISIEASPDTLRYLERTRAESRYADRWSVAGYAVGRSRGAAAFWVSNTENGAFDGLKDTGRGGAKQAIVIDVLPLDEVWRAAGSPQVSVIKIDVEGGEMDVIAGAQALIARDQPALIIEWSLLNLPAYNIEPGCLFDICGEIGYRPYAYPPLLAIDHETLLRAAMSQTETFLLLPTGSS